MKFKMYNPTKRINFTVVEIERTSASCLWIFFLPKVDILKVYFFYYRRHTDIITKVSLLKFPVKYPPEIESKITIPFVGISLVENFLLLPACE